MDGRSAGAQGARGARQALVRARRPLAGEEDAFLWGMARVEAREAALGVGGRSAGAQKLWVAILAEVRSGQGQG